MAGGCVSTTVGKEVENCWIGVKIWVNECSAIEWDPHAALHDLAAEGLTYYIEKSPWIMSQRTTILVLELLCDG